ncbi:hypothetical protein LEP1GSC060_0623 [Leptospira weilii serovar Ranarum str. ICFT]|uniref:Uncharacterized protein n=1 Tax=Leptospira weilii serovar Ranarum str. ICFT TaxID=1218598 RepID=N1WKT9_9LEPT|nr:hypothetical protein LEP1GSC060_0623 [Leptospira weilii serovar Ranarum str. ICFT]
MDNNIGSAVSQRAEKSSSFSGSFFSYGSIQKNISFEFYFLHRLIVSAVFNEKVPINLNSY